MEDSKAQKVMAMGGTEGGRRTTGVTPITGKLDAPDPEVFEHGQVNPSLNTSDTQYGI